MADAATMTIKAVILPEEIQATLKDLTFSYSLADNTEGWYYKLTDVTTTSANLVTAAANTVNKRRNYIKCKFNFS